MKQKITKTVTNKSCFGVQYKPQSANDGPKRQLHNVIPFHELEVGEYFLFPLKQHRIMQHHIDHQHRNTPRRYDMENDPDDSSKARLIRIA